MPCWEGGGGGGSLPRRGRSWGTADVGDGGRGTTRRMAITAATCRDGVLGIDVPARSYCEGTARLPFQPQNAWPIF